jgi:hypothetical protein
VRNCYLLRKGPALGRERSTSQAQENLLYNHNASEGNVTVFAVGSVNAVEQWLLECVAASPVNIKPKLRI